MSEPGNREPGRDHEATHFARIDPNITTVVSHDDELSVAAEHYRNLAFRVEEEARIKPLRGFVLAVTSAEPSTGKTLVSLNLAVTLARGEGRVLLIEGDLRRPTLESYLQTFRVVERDEDRPRLENDPIENGLWQVLDRRLTLEEAAMPLWGTKLEILVAGTAGNSSNVLAQREMLKLLAVARSRYEVVVIDAPPLILAAGRTASARADRTLLVVRAGQTQRKQIEGALSLVGQKKLLGVVLNGAKTVPEAPYSHYHHPHGDLPRPPETGDEPDWDPKALARPFSVKSGLALIATFLVAGR